MQAGRTSTWASMEHAGGRPWSAWALRPGAGTLEVTIDPAAHGMDAVGPLSRDVLLRTASGAQLQFTLKAVVTH